MPNITQLQADLELYRKAEQAVLIGGQSYEVAGRKLTRANLAEIRAAKADLEQRIALVTQPQHGHAVFGGRR